MQMGNGYAGGGTGRPLTTYVNSEVGIMTNDILTPTHPLWDTFTERLEGPEGCDFREDESGNITWHCRGGWDKSKSFTILNTMPDIDVWGTLHHFDDHGGHCDCEVLFNVKE